MSFQFRFQENVIEKKDKVEVNSLQLGQNKYFHVKFLSLLDEKVKYTYK